MEDQDTRVEIEDVKGKLNKTYINLIVALANKYIGEGLSTRLVLNIRNGDIHSLQDQRHIAGTSATEYYLAKE
jgi:hypothetical protein